LPATPALDRPVAFLFALDSTSDQRTLFAKCAGARRFTFNHHLARVKSNLDMCALEQERGLDPDIMTPPLSWTRFSFINEFNAYKNGQLDSSPVDEHGVTGLAWRSEIPSDVFECASADAAIALKNWKESRQGARAGVKMGFPRFSSKSRSTPSFRLRNRAAQGAPTQTIRFSDPRHLRLPKIGSVRVLGPTRKVRRMLSAGRLHLYSATLTQRAGRWYVSLTGTAAQLHHARRSPARRHQSRVGVDRGIKSLAVCADEHGNHIATFEGVRELRQAQAKLKAANQALARTTPGSNGRRKARAKLAKVYRSIANKRKHLVHQASSYLVANCTSLVIEDLNVAGMAKNHSLAKAVSDAVMGELASQLRYKSAWYGVELVTADRFFASSKICSGCNTVKDTLALSQRVYVCDSCTMTLDRDLNAAINLARWVTGIAQTPPPTPTPQLVPV
jgi:putative transposase